MKTRLTLNGFSWNLIFEHFSKIFRESSRFIKVWYEQRVLYMKTHKYILSYLAQFFLRWEMFQTKLVKKIKTHILCSVTFSRKFCRLWDNVEKYGRAGQATDDNIIRRMRIACWIPKLQTHTQNTCYLIAFPWQQFLHERASMLTSYVHCLSCFI
jgi:hypothetical protein